jgi:hypothetical protein
MKHTLLYSIALIITSLFLISFVSASWSNSLNNGLVAYWNFDNASAQVNDSVYHLVAFSTEPMINSSGHVGNATFFSGVFGNNWNTQNFTDEMQLNKTGQQATINFWILPRAESTSSIIDNRYNYGWFFYFYSVNNRLYINLGYNEYSETSLLPTYSWTMVTIVKNSTSTCDYINGVLTTCISSGGDIRSNDHVPLNRVSFGAQYDGSSVFNGGLDEIGIWTRALSDSEVSQLYNSGSGVTWKSPTTVPQIQYVSPTEDEFDFSQVKNIIVNVTATDPTLSNITIRVFNSSRDLVDSSITLTSPNYYNFSLATDGIYYYNATACNSENCNSTDTYVLVVDSTNPVTDIVYPEDHDYFASKPTYLNISAYNTGNISSCWFSMNGGFTNISLPNCKQGENNIFSGFDTYVLDGTNIVSVWANDTIGLYSLIPHVHTFYIDSINPTIQFNLPTPLNDSTFTSASIVTNVTAVDTNLFNITVFLYNSTGNQIAYYKTSTSPNYHIFTVTDSGTYYINAEAYDMVGHVATTELRKITITLPTPPPDVRSTAVYGIMNSGGAGIGKFFLYLAEALPLLLFGLAMVIIVLLIGFAFVNLLKHFMDKR